MSAHEVFFQQAAAADRIAPVVVRPQRVTPPRATKNRWTSLPEPPPDESSQSGSTLSCPTPLDSASLMQALRQLELLANRLPPRIAFKAKGTILLLDLAEIPAVQAEGNYVALRHQAHLYLVHESLSSIAEKLRPYGFIRIHRSVIVNSAAVKEIQSLPTGEYKVRVKTGEEYLVTRKYKCNLKDLAQLWVGAERLSGSRHP